MHDWTLVSLSIDWAEATIDITFKNGTSNQVCLVAEGLSGLRLSKREPWGESSSVNEVEGPNSLDNGNKYICIEIQSGDKIEIEAKSISVPAG